jgi:hypothetical protein
MLYQTRYREAELYVFGEIVRGSMIIDRIETPNDNTDILQLMDQSIIDKIALSIEERADEDTRKTDDEAALFDAHEANAINSGLGGF